jgi:hypothetical protein
MGNERAEFLFGYGHKEPVDQGGWANFEVFPE